MRDREKKTTRRTGSHSASRGNVSAGKLKYRYESFGGIIALEEPPALVFADRNYMRELGLKGSPVWKKRRRFLTAPTEVHFSVTNRCPVRCGHCYMDSGGPEEGELDTAGCKKMLDKLGQMGVFHAALGGGEAFARPDFLDIARHARKAGIVPNLTTNGYYMTPGTARKSRVFGQVNVSVNGLSGEHFRIADRALRRLKKAGVRCGINCLVSRENYGKLGEIFRYAASLELHDIEFLRYKPSGRGRNNYYAMKLTGKQYGDFFPYLMKLAEKYDVRTKIDCSFVPAVCYHNPDKKEMKRFAVYGCEAGNVLLSVFSNGEYAGCSFASRGDKKCTSGLKDIWENSGNLNRFRNWTKHAPEPCRSCDYLDICKGGCHMVAEYETGDFYAPDPACPKINRLNRDRHLFK